MEHRSQVRGCGGLYELGCLLASSVDIEVVGDLAGCKASWISCCIF
jgi:hypothetical protein